MFAKIFEQIYDSSIAEDWKTRIVFQDFLIMADKHGIVDKTLEAIARRTNLPLEMVQEAIPKLEAPDPASRTPDADGRRIERLDKHRNWGWRIINFEKYRESATKEMLRMADAERKRAYRARHGKPPSPVPSTPEQKQKAEAEADPSMDMSRTNGVSCAGRESPKLSVAEKIIEDKELERIEKELEDLKDANIDWAVERKRELRMQRDNSRRKLGLPPLPAQAKSRNTKNPRLRGQIDDPEEKRNRLAACLEQSRAGGNMQSLHVHSTPQASPEDTTAGRLKKETGEPMTDEEFAEFRKRCIAANGLQLVGSPAQLPS
jgi:regulator of replication initiation timing